LYFKNRNAFTMIELVFVIVVLGILAAVAIPKFAATRDDAQISNARATIGAVRSGIVSVRQKYLLRGQYGYINKLSSGTTKLFDGNGTSGAEILMYPPKPDTKNGHWSFGSGTNKYIFHLKGQSCSFTYNPADGTFKLDASQNAVCKPLDF
jgi:general secretion pathway protein G